MLFKPASGPMIFTIAPLLVRASLIATRSFVHEEVTTLRVSKILRRKTGVPRNPLMLFLTVFAILDTGNSAIEFFSL